MLLSRGSSFIWLLSTAHPLLAIAFTAWLCAFVTTSIPLLRRQFMKSRQAADQDAVLGGQTVDLLANIPIAHTYAKETFELRRIRGSHTDFLQADRNDRFSFVINKSHQGLSIVILVIGMVSLAVYLLGSLLINPADMVIVAAVIPVMSNMVWSTGDLIVDSVRKYGQAASSLQALQTETEVLLAGSTVLQATHAPVQFEQITFIYPGTKKTILEDFSLTAPAGQRVGIVGSSGAGKSTLVKLLLRQYDVDTGSVAIGAHNIKDVTLKSLRQAVAFVPQDTTLFHRSLFENIQYAKPEATLEEVIDVSKKAHTHDFIESLPQQYDTLVGERGVKLSGGQRQRIAIARAMLKNAPILVLDEATSALDGESEQVVQAGLHELFSGRTVIAIAHRLSTLREMDRIVVIEEGRIVEDGTPQDLLEKPNGIFKQKWEQQKGGFVS